MASMFLSISAITYSQQSEFNVLLIKESGAIAATEGRVSRDGPKLVIRTLKNEVVFSDNLTESESAARYIYISSYLENNYHLIYASGWEGHSFQLVHASTGKCTRLDGIPVLSPDNKLFVATSMDLEAGYNNNSVQICKLTRSGPATVFYHNYKGSCGPSNPKWLDNKTILFDINIPIQKDPELKIRRVNGKIKLRNKSWVII
jgi:hypothetical protein